MKRPEDYPREAYRPWTAAEAALSSLGLELVVQSEGGRGRRFAWKAVDARPVGVALEWDAPLAWVGQGRGTLALTAFADGVRVGLCLRRAFTKK